MKRPLVTPAGGSAFTEVTTAALDVLQTLAASAFQYAVISSANPPELVDFSARKELTHDQRDVDHRRTMRVCLVVLMSDHGSDALLITLWPERLAMTANAYLVAIWIAKVGAVVFGMIMRAQPGCSVIGSAMG